MSTAGRVLLLLCVLLALQHAECQLVCDPNCNTQGCARYLTGKCDFGCVAGYLINTTTHFCDRVPCQRTCNGTCAIKGDGTCDTTCITGYSVQNFSCVICASNCGSCVTNGRYRCDLGKCNNGFAIDPAYNTCAPCDSNCQSTCMKPGLCAQGGCKTGFTSKNVTATDYICAPCAPQCATTCTTNGAGTCDGLCMPGYSYNSTSRICFPCGQHCLGSCSAPGLCDGPCASGYVKSPTPGNPAAYACYPCATHCTSGCLIEGKGSCDVVTGASTGTCDLGLWITNPSKTTVHICS